MQTKLLPGNRHTWVFTGWILIFCASTPSVLATSFYAEKLNDPKAVYLSPSGGDDTAALQSAVDKVQETTRQGIVLLAPGQYHLSHTIYIWPGIRLIGYGAKRPVIILPANTPGFGDALHENVHDVFSPAGVREMLGTLSPTPALALFIRRSPILMSKSRMETRARSSCGHTMPSTVFSRTWISISAPRWPASTRAAT